MVDTPLYTEIESERLTLSRLREEDAEFVQRLVNTNGWIQFIGDRNVHSLDDAKVYVRRILSSPDIFYWVARPKDNVTAIGIVTLIKRAYLPHFDIGFAFLPEHAGRGYAYEAASKVMAMLKPFPEYNPILATTVPNNVQSIKLLTKLGLQFEREIEVDKERLHVYSNG
jgi:RimJ/RimL family protein N-acetyltransferase